MGRADGGLLMLSMVGRGLLPIGMGRPTGKPGGWFFQPGTKVPDFQLYIEEVLLNHFSRWEGFLKMSEDHATSSTSGKC